MNLWRSIPMVLVAAGILYAGFCAALYFIQRSLIYLPRPASNASGTTMTLPTPEGNVIVSTRPTGNRRALLYFGGNAEDVTLSLPGLAGAFPDVALYLPRYRGYGGSAGRPSESALFSDALRLFDMVHADHPEVIVVGRSLGSGVAVYVASRRPVSRLLLVTPFHSLQDIAAEQHPLVPVRWLLRDKFESWRYAPSVTARTQIIAAEHDELIPRRSTAMLQARFQPGLASMVVLPGTGHDTISNSPLYLPLLASAR
jgi:pimeloyl-ACP methyl ester carboxylesterase